MERRILDLAEKTNLGLYDYLVVDSEDGTRKHTARPLMNIQNSGDEYDSTKSYRCGELCIKNNRLYRCINACSASSWSNNEENFEVTTLTKEMSNRGKRTVLYSGSTTFVTQNQQLQLSDRLVNYAFLVIVYGSGNNMMQDFIDVDSFVDIMTDYPYGYILHGWETSQWVDLKNVSNDSTYSKLYVPRVGTTSLAIMNIYGIK